MNTLLILTLLFAVHAQIPMRARVQRKWPRLRGWVPEHPRARARARCAESKRDNSSDTHMAMALTGRSNPSSQNAQNDRIKARGMHGGPPRAGHPPRPPPGPASNRRPLSFCLSQRKGQMHTTTSYTTARKRAGSCCCRAHPQPHGASQDGSPPCPPLPEQGLEQRADCGGGGEMLSLAQRRGCPPFTSVPLFRSGRPVAPRVE
eukprot:gene24629-biopygen4430